MPGKNGAKTNVSQYSKDQREPVQRSDRLGREKPRHGERPDAQEQHQRERAGEDAHQHGLAVVKFCVRRPTRIPQMHA